MPPLVQFGSSVNIDVVSIHPRLFRRGNREHQSNRVEETGFNPPPPFQARERPKWGLRTNPKWFQSTPAFSGEGTPTASASGAVPRVSIHPRLFRRGNPKEHEDEHDHLCVSIHPRLFRRGNPQDRLSNDETFQFQSTPAFSGEGTALRQANDNRKVIRVVARTRLQLNSYAVNTPFPIK